VHLTGQTHSELPIFEDRPSESILVRLAAFCEDSQSRNLKFG